METRQTAPLEILKAKESAPKFVKVEAGNQLSHDRKCGPLHNIKNIAGQIANNAPALAGMLEDAGFGKAAKLLRQIAVEAKAVLTVSRDALSSQIGYEAGYPFARALGKSGAALEKAVESITEEQFDEIGTVQIYAIKAKEMPEKYREKVLNGDSATIEIKNFDVGTMLRHYAEGYRSLEKFVINGRDYRKGEIADEMRITAAHDSIEDMIDNLISNAAKYGTEVEMTAWKENGMLHIIVRDNGAGVPAGYGDKELFDEKVSLPNATWDSSHVGLPVSKRFAEEILGGTLKYLGQAYYGAEKPGAAFELVVPDLSGNGQAQDMGN